MVVMAIRNHCTGSGFEALVGTAHSCGMTHPTAVALAPHTCGMEVITAEGDLSPHQGSGGCSRGCGVGFHQVFFQASRRHLRPLCSPSNRRPNPTEKRACPLGTFGELRSVDACCVSWCRHWRCDRSGDAGVWADTARSGGAWGVGSAHACPPIRCGTGSSRQGQWPPAPATPQCQDAACAGR